MDSDRLAAGVLGAAIRYGLRPGWDCMTSTVDALAAGLLELLADWRQAQARGNTGLMAWLEPRIIARTRHAASLSLDDACAEHQARYSRVFRGGRRGRKGLSQPLR